MTVGRRGTGFDMPFSVVWGVPGHDDGKCQQLKNGYR